MTLRLIGEKWRQVGGLALTTAASGVVVWPLAAEVIVALRATTFTAAWGAIGYAANDAFCDWFRGGVAWSLIRSAARDGILELLENAVWAAAHRVGGEHGVATW